MNSHKIGEENEKKQQKELLAHYAKLNPKVIDLKHDKVHGLDWALVSEDNSFVMIVESKSAKGRISGQQAEADYTKRQLEKLYEKQPKHEIFSILENSFSQDGEVIFRGIKSTGEAEGNLQSKATKPRHKLDKSILPSGLKTKKTVSSRQATLKQTTTQTSKTMSLEKQVEQLSKSVGGLNALNSRLEELRKLYDDTLEGIKQNGSYINYIAPLQNQHYAETASLIKDLRQHIEANDLKYLDDLIGTIKSDPYYKG